MTLTKHIVIACLALAPALALANTHAGAPSFYTTGGRTQLGMTTLAVTPTTMKVRLTDPTKMAFARKSATVTLTRQAKNGVAGWTAFEGPPASKSHPGISMTIQDQALAGKHGIVGMNLTGYDALSDGPKDYGVHFQLAGKLPASK